MNNTPRISILLPTFDRARLLPESIASVQAQTLADWELLAVDDGSTDDTPTVVAGIGDARVHLLRVPHRGISAALNAGLAAARGALVARIDSDDVWLPDLLSSLAAALEKAPEAGLAYARAGAMDAGARPLPAWASRTRGAPPCYPGAFWKSMLAGDFTCNIAMLARRKVFDTVGGYDESLPANEDWDLLTRAARRFPFVFVDRTLARFRLHPGSVTDAASPALGPILASRLRVLDKAFAEPDIPDDVAALRPTFYRNAHVAIGQRWLEAGRSADAVRAFRQAFATGAPSGTTAALIGKAACRAPAKAIYRRLASVLARLGGSR